MHEATWTLSFTYFLDIETRLSPLILKWDTFSWLNFAQNWTREAKETFHRFKDLSSQLTLWLFVICPLNRSREQPFSSIRRVNIGGTLKGIFFANFCLVRGGTPSIKFVFSGIKAVQWGSCCPRAIFEILVTPQKRREWFILRMTIREIPSGQLGVSTVCYDSVKFLSRFPDFRSQHLLACTMVTFFFFLYPYIYIWHRDV